MKSHSVSHCYLLGTKKEMKHKKIRPLAFVFFSQESAWETENQLCVALHFTFYLSVNSVIYIFMNHMSIDIAKFYIFDYIFM